MDDEVLDSETEFLGMRWVYGTITAAYVLSCVGHLKPGTRRRIDDLMIPGEPTWDETVEADHGIDREFVQGLHAHLTQTLDEYESVVFILRGLGCPDITERIQDLASDALKAMASED